jgi:hypothetical protein
MKRLNVVSPLLVLALAAQPALAETEFGDSVPREVVNQFISDQIGGGAGKLYSDILDAFPPFTVPDAFTVLASADQGYVRRVVLKTSLDAEAAKAAVVEAFIAEDWQQMPVFGGAAPQTGFVSATPSQTQPTSLCKDGLGNVSINVTGDAAPRYLSVSHSSFGAMRGGQQMTCAEQIQMYSQGPGGLRGRQGPQLGEYMPRLVMPEANTPAPQRSVLGMSSGGSSNDWETDAMLASDQSIDELLEHFTSQVDAQGWAGDSEVAGANVATASWTKTIDDMELLGLLTILELADDNWEMKFRIVRKNTAGGAAVNRAVDEVRAFR